MLEKNLFDEKKTDHSSQKLSMLDNCQLFWTVKKYIVRTIDLFEH